MPDYQKMYVRLFQSQTKAITLLQEAQKDTEDMYIEAEPPSITVFPKKEVDKTDEDGDKE